MSTLPRRDLLRDPPKPRPAPLPPSRALRPFHMAEGELTAHAAQHKSGGGDALTPAAIGAAPTSHSHPAGSLGAPSELTISSGTITKAGSYHTVDTEGDAATDDLDTINGGVDGDLLFIRPDNDARTVVVRHNTGNILCVGNANITLDDAHDFAILIFDGSLAKWIAR